jgi:hypothetical protein
VLSSNNRHSPDAKSRTDMPPQVDGIVDGVSHMSTKDLPDGSPEDELKTAKDHKLGHLQSAKKIINS